MERHEGQTPKEEAIADDSHILAVSSGNAQTHCYIDEKVGTYAPLSSRISTRTTTQRYPAPTTTLKSNDHRVQSQHRLKTRRLQKRYELAKRCWSHPAYAKYLERPRRDVDKKGEIIWHDDVERAFANAVVNIPAMGKSKKSQHGKACGRNELIQEWILQETGKKRERKQVSSHIQVFDSIFKGTPEWKALNKVSKNSSSDDVMKDDEYEYYSNSIADMVRIWKALNNQSPDSEIEPQAGHSGCLTAETSLSRLYFEMWISQPEKIDQVLHRFTQVQCDRSVAPPELLEGIEGWRTFWPDLVPVVESRSPHEEFDIILLEASCQLKDDFPPPKSKLGISLELEFSSSSPDRNFFAIPSLWSCTSHFYQKGKLEAKADYNECHSLGPGKVEPPFESKWWAEKFIQLTKKRRQALDFGNDDALSAADESTRGYLHNLKVMQQISLGLESIQSPRETWYDHNGTRRRMAVLLWSFSQASGKNVGVTTWKRLIPPPRRVDMNSPSLAATDMSLPPFNIDSVMDATTDENLFSLHPDPSVPILTSNEHLPNNSEERYGSQQITAQLSNNTGLIDAPYHRITYVDNVPLGYQHVLDLQHNTQCPQETVLQNSYQPLYQAQPILSSNYFEAQEEWGNAHSLPEDNYYHDQQSHHVIHSQSREEYGQRQPLLDFDMNTHALLQAQIETSHQDIGSSVSDLQQQPDLYQQALSEDPQQIQSIDNGANIPSTNDKTFDSNTDTHIESVHPQESDREQKQESIHVDQPEIAAPTALRPTLHHYHTFAGEPRYGSEAQTSLSGHPRSELALLLEGFDSSCKDDQAHVLSPASSAVHGLGMTRPHTEPLPLPTPVRDSMYQDVGQVPNDEQSLLQSEWVDVKLER